MIVYICIYRTFAGRFVELKDHANEHLSPRWNTRMSTFPLLKHVNKHASPAGYIYIYIYIYIERERERMSTKNAAALTKSAPLDIFMQFRTNYYGCFPWVAQR